MSLSLLTGPAGSGKTGAVLDRVTEVLGREPLLVVPTRADVERFEEELLARLPVVLGARIVTFGGLVEQVTMAAAATTPPLLTDAQREAVLRSVAAAAPLDVLAEPARRRGFAAALVAFVDELRAAGVQPQALAASGRGGPEEAFTRELGLLYEGYLVRLRALGRADRHDRAAAAEGALRSEPDALGGRPVFVHGFDDLTPEQHGLIEALAVSGEVLVSVVHEPGRAALAARARLVGLLEPAAERHETLSPHPGSGLLSHLERTFLEEEPERRPPGEELRLLEAAGPRNEVEQVAAQVARLLRDGSHPEDVVLISRSPDGVAALVEQVFGAYGVPVAADARVPFGHTAVGRGLLALLRAATTPNGSARDVVTFLRSSGRGAGGTGVDRLERELLRGRIATAEEAVTAWQEGGRNLWELGALRTAEAAGPQALVSELAAIARNLFEFPLRRRAPMLDAREREDQLAAEAAAGALEEVAELCELDPGLAPDSAGLADLLEEIAVPRHAGPVAGHIELLSPYRARARRFGHVFVLGLQEGEFPRRGREDPFLDADARRRAGLPERAESADEERFLFYACLTRATRGLYLSWQSADEEGRVVTRSPFVEDVLDLLELPHESAHEAMTSRKQLSATVFEPAGAPAEHELARALALRGALAVPGELQASAAVVARLEPRLRRAAARARHLPGPLTVPAVLEELRGRKLMGASTLEQNAECSFRHFVGHELRPRELEPEPDARHQGSVLHAVLEALYNERGRPTPESLEEHSERASAMLAEHAQGGALGRRTPQARTAYRRLESDLVRFLRWDSQHDIGLEPQVMEASFGDKEDDEKPPLALDGFSLHGRIDRIDVGPAGAAFVRDYKRGGRVPKRAELEEGRKLQLPLYMLAVRELWGLDPVGAAYHPFADQYGHKPRGLLRGPLAEAVLPAEHFTKSDFTATPEEFEAHLQGARAEGARIAARIQAGHLTRDPLNGTCMSYCDFHPICRRERGDKNPQEEQKVQQQREPADA